MPSGRQPRPISRARPHEGWRLAPGVYDDGGFSGGTLERPGLQHLLQDVRDRKIDVIVVYKVDRLTRSLADFAKLVELFDQHSASFVSVTQAFNTTSSMGRLTLNVLLSFAQFEREVTAERIRDKIAASKKKGIWVGGNTPFDYRVEDRKLVIDPAEAKVVRMIFQRYLALGSLSPLLEELHRKGIRTRKRRLSSGQETGGNSFMRGALNALLKNRTYIGELNHKGKSYPGEHKALIDRTLFEAVQAKMEANVIEIRMSRGNNNYLLEGLLFDDRGNRMSPTYTRKGGARYRYYTCRLLYDGRCGEAGKIKRVNATDVEQAVTEAVRGAARLPQPAGAADLRALVAKVCLEHGKLRITLIAPKGGAPRDIEVPWQPKHGRRRREIILPHTDQGKDGRPIRSETREHMVWALALGRTWLAELTSNRSLTIDQLAEREGRSRRSVQMLLSLNALSPDIVRGLIAGKLPRGIGITRLFNLPLDWSCQFQALGVRPIC